MCNKCCRRVDNACDEGITGSTGQTGPTGYTGPTGPSGPNTNLILYQVADTSGPTGNIISRIGNAAETSIVACSSGPPALQLVCTDVIQINSGTSNLQIVNLPNTVTTTTLYFDNITKNVSYGAATGGPTGARGATGPTGANGPTGASGGALTDGFCVRTNLAITDPASPYTFPSGTSFSNSPAGFNTGLLNTSTGTITIPATGRYMYSMNINWTNAGATAGGPDTLTLELYNIGTFNSVQQVSYTVTDAQPNSYILCGVGTFTSGNTLSFRLSYSLTTGVQTIASGAAGVNSFMMQRLT